MQSMREHLAVEVAERLGAVLLNLICPACGSPMLGKPEQNYLPFCWDCVTSKETAQRGKTLLVRARLALRGIVLEENHYARPDIPKERIEGSPWPEDWAI